ncbi:MAG TPA: MarR family transcriptional regulator [Anaerolineae bacterium]|nr:MarR family transcriptional regulator [Anaerolineae bacterium]HQK15031.1 MarR family transcriptional regulator [Anaerolineae bacterium]
MNEPERSPALVATQKFLSLYRYLRQYSQQMHDQGVRGREFATLRYLHEAGPCTIGQVQEYIYISASAASEMLSRLENAGYVTRKRCTKDQRVVYVELTPEGRRLAEETPLGGIPLLRERIKTLSPEQLDTVIAAFDILLQVMEIKE